MYLILVCVGECAVRECAQQPQTVREWVGLENRGVDLLANLCLKHDDLLCYNTLTRTRMPARAHARPQQQWAGPVVRLTL